MSEANFEVITDPEILSEAANQVGNDPAVHEDITRSLLVAEIGKGVVRFAERVFKEGGLGHVPEVYAEVHQRSEKGRGPHFDIYDADPILDEPLIAVYNLAGVVSLKATLLSPELTENYRANFPDPDEAAYQARRDYASIALRAPQSHVRTTTIRPDMGFIIAQHPGQAPVVHDLTPLDPAQPGAFVKLILPRTDSEEAQERLSTTGYRPLDEVITAALTETAVGGSAQVLDMPSPATTQSSGARRGRRVYD